MRSYPICGPLEGDDFEIRVFGQVNVHRGGDRIGMIVLQFGQSAAHSSRMIVACDKDCDRDLMKETGLKLPPDEVVEQLTKIMDHGG